MRFFLVVALALAGLPGQWLAAASDDHGGVVFQTTQKQSLTLRSAEAKPCTRKAPEPLSTHLVCPRDQIAVREPGFGSSRVFWSLTTNGGVFQTDGPCGRAPPIFGQA